ncbi:(d)CMP kinase [Fundicoccus culcitae]|uniref:Cytidylate kinase n=1 Tax=Fundicoccus culcitae TaxID=2969821 RepID=A0ABY5P728_9LACT|nr:(d)CMP kinase [Fundicoccus culcitae]UUX34541.1 (d)CMP kinase [Fundicoccus culcitae]
MENFAIAIDGPASSGKSTVAKAIAQRLDIIYIDTGAMYRAITFLLMEANIEFDQLDQIEALLKQVDFKFNYINQELHLFVNERDVASEIRSVEVTRNVSEVSAIPIVREILVEKQREIAKGVSVVMDGRDIGTVVLPDAKYKFFLTALPSVRAERRYQQNLKNNLTSQTLEEIEADIIRRDHYDSTREISPLKKAEDAILIDSSKMSIEDVIEFIIQNIYELNQ